MFLSKNFIELPKIQTVTKQTKTPTHNTDVKQNEKLITVKPGFMETFKDDLALSKNSTAIDLLVFPLIIIIAFFFAIILSFDGYQTTE